MKNFLLFIKNTAIAFLTSIIIVLSVNAQEDKSIIGSWTGELKFQSVDLRIVFNIEENETGGLSAAMDSPDQGAFGIKVDKVIFNGRDVTFKVNTVAGFFKGVFEKDSSLIRGSWNQSGMSLPVVLTLSENAGKLNRPQEPKKPFPYIVQAVKFENDKAGATLAGTLTIPDSTGIYPAVILVSGSGPENRDEELFGHKPFAVLADYLTRNGIAVLRYDDRGVGESTGNFASGTTEDFMNDVLAAVEFLKSRGDVDNNYIGIIGHSEGGLIAPMTSVKSHDVAFIVLLAAPGLRGDKLILVQSALIQRANNISEDIIERDSATTCEIFKVLLTEADNNKAAEKLKKIIRQKINQSEQSKELNDADRHKIVENKLNSLLNPWFRYFVNYDPYPVLTKVRCPVLVLNGEKDLQVPPDENLPLIEKALTEAGNDSYKIIELKGLNHMFQHCNTGSPMEYSKIEETFSPEAMKIIADWIKGLVNKK